MLYNDVVILAIRNKGTRFGIS